MSTDTQTHCREMTVLHMSRIPEQSNRLLFYRSRQDTTTAKTTSTAPPSTSPAAPIPHAAMPSSPTSTSTSPNGTTRSPIWSGSLRPKSVHAAAGETAGRSQADRGPEGRGSSTSSPRPTTSRPGKTMLALLGKDTPAEVRDRALENLRLFLPTKWKALANGKELKQAIDELLARRRDAQTSACDSLPPPGGRRGRARSPPSR